jgi:hypothetical protein
MLEPTVGSQIVATCISSPTQWALEPPWEVNMIVVANVGYNFATKFTSVQVGVAWKLVKCKSHVPGF